MRDDATDRRSLELADPEPAHVCYRIVRHDPPTADDFTSYWDMRRRPRQPTPKEESEYEGVSVYDTEEHARANADRNPGLGSYIARLVIPGGAPITVGPIRNMLTEHHNLHGVPDDMVVCVAAPVMLLTPR